MMRLIRFFLLIFCIAPILSAYAADEDSLWYERDQQDAPHIKLYFFWSTHCPHCQAALPYVSFIEQAYPWLSLQSYQLVGEADNIRRYEEMARKLGQKAQSVPGFMFCNTMMTGFEAGKTPNQLIEGLKDCRNYLTQHPDLRAYRPLYGSNRASPEIIELPFFGELTPEAHNLAFITMAVAAVDAFNPCAFFVLMFLLSMMLHLGSRRRMFLVGGVFVFFSGLVYFLFMSAWLNLFRMIGQLEMITLVAALVAVVVGLINIKDFFWFRTGVSLTIPEKAKPGLYQRTRRLLHSRSLYTLIGATIVLSFFANLYELLCTAGFPMVYTRILTLHNLQTSQYYLYLLLYSLIYVVPLMIIVLVFIGGLGSRKLQEQEGRSLKLISGMMMLALGVVLLASPSLLNNLFLTLIILLAAIGLALLLIMLDRKRKALYD
jgi:thiol-disulfide isomerase/thioredoxin